MPLDWQSHSPRQVGVYAVTVECSNGTRYWCKAFWDAQRNRWREVCEPIRGKVMAHATVELAE